MLCQNCGERPAALRTVFIAGGVKQELYICEECARKRGIPLNKMPVLIKLISGRDQRETPAHKVCPACGSSLKSLGENGVLGCAECYKALREPLTPFVKRAQGGRLKHVGRRPLPPTQPPKPVRDGSDELKELEEKLKQAVAREEYEQAAVLRDAVRALKSQREEGAE